MPSGTNDSVSRYSLHVKPRSSKAGVRLLEDGSLEVRVHAPPEDGRANEEVIERVAAHFGVKRRFVSIVTGESSRHKIVDVDGAGE